MYRQILHVDCNKFYASVECCLNPELRDKPIAVGGSEETRHGIILTKNEIAARYGLITGEPLWAARRKCPELIVIPPHFPAYIRFSKMVRGILSDYTDRIEPFGLDEAWLELTGGRQAPEFVAQEIRCRVREELGITVSIGISFTKPFAKLGSDYKKPDAVTAFTPENYRKLVWALPVGDLIYVGNATRKKLEQRYIYTIGDLAAANPSMLQALLGKWGMMLYAMANGQDNQPVIPTSEAAAAQSISNGMTSPRDMENEQDVRIVLYVLAESVGRRLREQHLLGKTVELQLRDTKLTVQNYRTTLNHFIRSTDDIAREALALFRKRYGWKRPLRTLTVGVSGLEPDTIPCQLDLLDSENREKRETLDRTVDDLKRRFGDRCIRRAVVMEDPTLAGLSPYEDHTIHPVGFSGKVEICDK